MSKGRILITDDETTLVRALTRFLEGEGYKVDQAFDGPEAIEKCKTERFDLVLTDLQMPSMDGLTMMEAIKKIDSQISFIIMTGFGSIPSAIEAIKRGAFHYITKPFELVDIGMLVAKAIEHAQLKQQNTILKTQVSSRYGFEKTVGMTDEWESIIQVVRQVAQSDSTVLILGESGTGKELVARALHYNSGRLAKPLITVNCGAIPENLLESELFGYMKGAFTGAVHSKMGRFEMADGGSIFLDEIGDMSLKLQVKLLRVLQERKFEPVGSSTSVEIDVRIIAATNRNLEELVEKGEFREDLYYRLNVIPIQIPPLRARRADIPLLVDHFLNHFSKGDDQKKPKLSKEILKLFSNYQWPGNVRELENTIERLTVLTPGKNIEVTDLPQKFIRLGDTIYKNAEIQIPDSGVSLKVAVDDFENTLIIKALEKTGWNKNKAATLLKLNRTTLVEKIKKKKLERLLQKAH